MKARITVALILTVVLLICVANQAGAQGLAPHAFKEAQERQALIRLYGQTVLCMRNATLAIMRVGGGKALAYSFVAQSCGVPLVESLTKISGWSAPDAERLVAGMVVREVDHMYPDL